MDGVVGVGEVLEGPTPNVGPSSLPSWPSRVASFCASPGDGRAEVSQFFLLFEEALDSPEFEEFLLL